VCVGVLLFCCSVSSVFLSCVLCACDLLIVLKYDSLSQKGSDKGGRGDKEDGPRSS